MREYKDEIYVAAEKAIKDLPKYLEFIVKGNLCSFGAFGVLDCYGKKDSATILASKKYWQERDSFEINNIDTIVLGNQASYIRKITTEKMSRGTYVDINDVGNPELISKYDIWSGLLNEELKLRNNENEIDNIEFIEGILNQTIIDTVDDNICDAIRYAAYVRDKIQIPNSLKKRINEVQDSFSTLYFNDSDAFLTVNRILVKACKYIVQNLQIYTVNKVFKSELVSQINMSGYAPYIKDILNLKISNNVADFILKQLIKNKLIKVGQYSSAVEELLKSKNLLINWIDPNTDIKLQKDVLNKLRILYNHTLQLSLSLGSEEPTVAVHRVVDNNELSSLTYDDAFNSHKALGLNQFLSIFDKLLKEKNVTFSIFYDGKEVRIHHVNGYDVNEEISIAVKSLKINDLPLKTEYDNRNNGFSYNDSFEISGGAKTLYRHNVDSIKILKECLKNNRQATIEEQEILSKYVGWGGIQDAFDEKVESWSKEYKELSTLLTPEEYSSARSSTTTSFYTPKSIIDNIYKALISNGFVGGKVLEPSCGVGNFISAMPGEIRQNSEIDAVEIDNVSGNIATLLHQDTNVHISGYEKCNFQDNSYDLIVGNIPFGDFKVYDLKYNKYNYSIHDYFIAKSIDLIKPGGLIVFVTSKFTLDKENRAARVNFAEKAKLIGAIRLPNNTFTKNAKTNVTSDIVIFQKKVANEIDNDLSWLDVSSTGINKYFVENEEKVIGQLKEVSSRFGSSIECIEDDTKDITNKRILKELTNILAEKTISVDIEKEKDEDSIEIQALPNIKDYSYAVVENKLYYREGSTMQLCSENKTNESILKDICTLKDAVHNVIDIQLQQNFDENIFDNLLKKLNEEYDKFVKKHGFINSKAVGNAIKNDIDASLLRSMEKPEEEENLYSKADIFFEATISTPKEPSADCPEDAVICSMNNKGRLDLKYMTELLSEKYTEEQIVDELSTNNRIFKNPETSQWEIAEEYLSGNVRSKIQIAETLNQNGEYDDNINNLKEVLPQYIYGEEIKVNFGASWIETPAYEDFIYDILGIYNIQIQRYDKNNDYFIKNKNNYSGRTSNNSTYGSLRAPALNIIESMLNSKTVEVLDRIQDYDGNYKYVRNEKETMYAQSKSEILKEKFREWFFQNEERRKYYEEKYNNLFNSTVIRQSDGTYLNLPGTAKKIILKQHQKNAVARILRNGNTLLGHCVGAGKSFTMIAAAMELKRLGQASKPAIIVPNSLVGQMGAEFLRLYPNAHILVTNDVDFEKKKRKAFITKISTGNYDAVIMGHSQFEKIGISSERQENLIKEELDELEEIIYFAKLDGKRITVKNVEKQKKNLTVKLEKLQRKEYKDQEITFEETGIDALFIDEAHMYKNLELVTKMTRVAGVQTTGSMRAQDLYAKIKYIQEKTPNRNVIFATGTPISNTMCEMYTMQKYLAEEELARKGIHSFDSWAANYGEVITDWELAPEGNNYQPRTKFAKFNNLPELLVDYHSFADIKMADSLNLDVPSLKNGKHTIIETEPNEYQQAMMDKLVERAEAIRNGNVNPKEDNMLKLCNDARLIAADPRLYDSSLVDVTWEKSKLDAVVENVNKIYIDSEKSKGTQVIFSDIGTPTGKKDFTIYGYIKQELKKKGINEKEIAFIHDAKTDKQRELLFDKVNSGNVRIIIGSTQKLGTGTNIQKRLIAAHEVDVPWRPSDVEQREGRIIRQGNENKEIEILRYVTKGTFDAYNWNIIENKQRFISQVMNSKDYNKASRSCDDIDETVLSYAEVKAIATGNPAIKEKMEIDSELQKIRILHQNYLSVIARLNQKVDNVYPNEIERIKNAIKEIENDALYCKTLKLDAVPSQEEEVKRELLSCIDNKIISGRNNIGKFVLAITNKLTPGTEQRIGNYLGFDIKVKSYNNGLGLTKELTIKRDHIYLINISETTEIGITIKIDNLLKSMDKLCESKKEELSIKETNRDDAIRDIHKPFDKLDRYNYLLKRSDELNELLFTKNEEKQENIIASAKQTTM